MEDYYRKKKRAANMVWTAADNYELEPMYLFYTKKDEPALYPNTAEGLAYRCLDQEAVVPFLEGMECGKETDRFRAYAVLIMEAAVYHRMSGERPSLTDLRRDYAAHHLQEMRDAGRYDNLGWERQEILRCRRVLGMDTSDFDSREIEFAEEMERIAALPEQEMVSEAKALFWRFFYYKFTPSRKSETTDFVGAGLFLTLMSRIMGAQLHGELNLDHSGETQNGRSSRLLTFWKHLLSQTTGDEDREFILQTFGPCMFTDQQLARIQENWCKGYHTRSQLWYTGAGAVDPTLGEEMMRQMHRNRSFYLADQRTFERNIRHITDHLKHALEEQQEPDIVHLQNGHLDAKQVYRIRCMHDLNVFRREITFPDPDFTVDLVLDASNSRYKEQEAIAAQAYIITRSLLNLEIPVQVTSFRSLRGYTVLQQLKTYDSNDAEGIFRYFCVGNNRDGLALQAMHPLMEMNGSDQRKRIVLVLTDALPSDTQKAYIPGTLRKGEDYDSDLAAEDTRLAVQQLRQEGARVAAVFWGGRYAVPNLKRIYGDAYIRILTITQFPDAVIGLLLRILGQLKDQENAS